MKGNKYFEIQPVCATLQERSEKVSIIFSDTGQSQFLPVQVDSFEAEMFVREMIGDNQNTAAIWLSEMMADSPPTEAILHPEMRRIELRFHEESWNHGRMLGLSDGITVIRRLSCSLIAHQEAFEAQKNNLDELSASGAFTNSSLYFDPQLSPSYGGFWGFSQNWNRQGAFHRFCFG